MTLWTRVASETRTDETVLVQNLIAEAALSPDARASIVAEAASLVARIRAQAHPGLMEVFLAEYGLSTQEGVALMCLAEALLRVPDAETVDRLIEDKIAPADWGRHLGRSASSLVNASTWALMLTGKVLEEREPGIAGHLRGAVKRLGEPVIRGAVARAIKEMGRAFVLGETIETAMARAANWQARGYTFSYDMLGEAARTENDARRYHLSYSRAIIALAGAAKGRSLRDNPGISVKLSALHPRYEWGQRARVMTELCPRLLALAGLARSAGIGLNVDAEESDRLLLSLEVIQQVLSDPSLAGWEGFGVVVQAYGRRAGAVIDDLHALALKLDRKIMVRLVKGAYWDSEIKRAQVLGLDTFPVLTRKEAADASYLGNARKLLSMTARIYPQFATHNAHTVAGVLHLAAEMKIDPQDYEFQRLHGMGEALHELILSGHGTRCRIYAPVGAHRDLLAYLVRRLLENGANSSFVNQIVNAEIPPEVVAACPLTRLESALVIPNPLIPTGAELYPGRINAKGLDLTDPADLDTVAAAREPHRTALYSAAPLLAAPHLGALREDRRSPSDLSNIGDVLWSAPQDVETALSVAKPWSDPPEARAAILTRAADLFEAHTGLIFALLAREAGKTLPDAVSELREAVDFLRYYAAGASQPHPARGIFACISPWNFPLAIFTGQIAAALAAGCAVIAKPAEQTPLIAHLAVTLLHQAGVPARALQLLPGDGAIGAALTRDPRVAGVAFTGSTDTARTIRSAMARHLAPGAPLIAETGGLNAMVVDSTALPEQVVRDILASAFQSAGQRCSALRCLYLQDEIAEPVLDMLMGAMEALRLGDPWELTTDIGPLIDASAKAGIAAHIAAAKAEGRVLKMLAAPGQGSFVSPALIRVTGIADLPGEVFGPVLHVATFRAADLPAVLGAINATGFGLTFGFHSRIDDRVERAATTVRAGNLYVNRNQIGAVVGSQPFGGEGLSGTGPKAGGPQYLARFTAAAVSRDIYRNTDGGIPHQSDGGMPHPTVSDMARDLAAAPTAEALRTETLPGPTGESNRLMLVPRAPLLCLGPGFVQAEAQALAIRALGGHAVNATGLAPEALIALQGFSGALHWGDLAQARLYALALSQRPGPILPLITEMPDLAHVLLERVICIDTTASGGNAQLLAQVSDNI